jgi:uncharacterized membrane protein
MGLITKQKEMGFNILVTTYIATSGFALLVVGGVFGGNVLYVDPTSTVIDKLMSTDNLALLVAFAVIFFLARFTHKVHNSLIKAKDDEIERLTKK